MRVGRSPAGRGASSGRRREPRVRDYGPKGRDPAAVCRGSTPLASVVCSLTEPKPDPGASRGHARPRRPVPFVPAQNSARSPKVSVRPGRTVTLSGSPTWRPSRLSPESTSDSPGRTSRAAVARRCVIPGYSRQ